MATRTMITLEDDIDGSPAEETVRFGLGAAEYEIDLSAANASRLREQLACPVPNSLIGADLAFRGR